MAVLYLRNVPDELGERLARLAARDSMSVSAWAVRELNRASLRADNPHLLENLPDLGVAPAGVVEDLEDVRAER